MANDQDILKHVNELVAEEKDLRDKLQHHEIDETERIFSNPSVQATEDYISGRFG